MPVDPVRGNVKQEGWHGIKASLDCIERPYLKPNKTKPSQPKPNSKTLHNK